MNPHANAGQQGWKLSGRAVGCQCVTALLHLHLSLAKESPVPVYLKVASGRAHPVTQLSFRDESGHLFIEVLQQGRGGFAGVQCPHAASVGFDYSRGSLTAVSARSSSRHPVSLLA